MALGFPKQENAIQTRPIASAAGAMRLLLFLGCCFLATLFPYIAGATALPSCPAGDLNCDSCISGAMFSDPSFGKNVIDTIFNTINAVISNAAQQFYQNSVGSLDFQQFITATISVYIATYGAMIMFGIIPVKPYDVSVRLIKIALVWALVDTRTGWNFFLQWIGGPLMMMMNQLIVLFNNVGTGSNVSMPSTISNIGTLNSSTMAIIEPSITQIFSIKYFVAIASHAGEGNTGWILVIILLWALKDYALMLLGAVFTYIKAIIGLAFLFGIAPVFIVFILFEKTRQAYLGWLSHVISFTFQPVLLFAFLAFYIGMITNALNGIMGNTIAGVYAPDYCYVKWFSFPGGLWDIYWWRPTDSTGTPIAGDYPINTPPSTSTFNALYFLVLCHLGYSFSKYIQSLASSLTGGLTVGMRTMQNMGAWTRGNLMGGQSFGGIASNARNWFSRPSGKT